MSRGSIKKEATAGGVRWRVRVDMTDPLTGKRRQPQRTYKTKRAATVGLAEWLVEIERGTAVLPASTTVGAYLEYWLTTSAQHRVRPTTLASYRYLVDTYIVPALGSTPVQRLTPAQVQSFYTLMLTSGRLRSGAGLSSTTTHYLHAILRSALKEAVRLGLVTRNVTDAVAAPRPIHCEAASWSIADIQRFLAAAAGDGYSPLWLLALSTGMRRGELLGLRWSDVDLDRGAAQIRQSLVLARTATYIQQSKTASGRRTVALDAACVAALRERRTRQRERRTRQRERRLALSG